MPKPTKLQRIVRWIFPYRTCDLPDVKDGCATVIHIEARVSIMDRFRLLFTGRCEICTKSETVDPENCASAFSVLPPASLKADPPAHKTRLILPQ